MAFSSVQVMPSLCYFLNSTLAENFYSPGYRMGCQNWVFDIYEHLMLTQKLPVPEMYTNVLHYFCQIQSDLQLFGLIFSHSCLSNFSLVTPFWMLPLNICLRIPRYIFYLNKSRQKQQIFIWISITTKLCGAELLLYFNWGPTIMGYILGESSLFKVDFIFI